MRRKLFILLTIFAFLSMYGFVANISALVMELRLHDVLIVDGNGRLRALTASEERQRKMEPLLGAIACATPPALCTYLAALHLRDRKLRRYRMKSGRCTGCGYDLTALTSGVCPECGTSVAGTEKATP